MNLNFIGDECHAILKFVHCHETNDKAAKIVESTAKTVMTVTEQARTQGQSVNVTINQSFHFGSGTYINLTHESQAVFNFVRANQPVIPPKNSPLGTPRKRIITGALDKSPHTERCFSSETERMR